MRPLSRLWTVALVAGLVYGLPTMAKTAAPPQSTRPTVAVMDFDFGTVENWWGGNVDVGKGIADMMVEGLVDDGSWRIIERKNFNASDRVDPSQKAAKLGKVIGVKFMLVGSITKFGTENSNKSVGGGAFGGGKFGIGKVGTSSGKANVAISARVIDTSTAEVMLIGKGEGTSKRSGLLLGGAGGGGGGGAGGGLNFGASNFKETIIGEATDAAVKDTVAKLLAHKDRLNGGF
jgi:curli biogenesis system outer membrane secretion channel CsgG